MLAFVSNARPRAQQNQHAQSPFWTLSSGNDLCRPVKSNISPWLGVQSWADKHLLQVLL